MTEEALFVGRQQTGAKRSLTNVVPLNQGSAHGLLKAVEVAFENEAS